MPMFGNLIKNPNNTSKKQKRTKFFNSIFNLFKSDLHKCKYTHMKLSLPLFICEIQKYILGLNLSKIQRI